MAKDSRGSVTNVNRGGKVAVQVGNGDGEGDVTNVNEGGVVGIQAGNISGSTIIIR